MKYSKEEMGPYNLHIIKTNKFKTINIRIDFKREAKKEELTNRRLLCDILLESTANYPQQRLLMIAKEDLYNLKLSSSTKISGKETIISFCTQFLNEKYTEKGMLEKSLIFFLESIFKPDLEKGKFKENKLSSVKKKALDDYLEREKKPSSYASFKTMEIMDPNAYYTLKGIGYKEDLKHITTTTLTDYYKKVINSDIINIFIIGDVDSQVIKKIFKRKVLVNTIKKPGLDPYLQHNKLRKRARKVKESFDAKQSHLVMGAKLGKLSEDEKKYVWYIYDLILGKGPDSRLFNSVREKNSLCYSISSQIKSLSNILIIKAGINKADSEKAIRLIRKEIKNISKGLIEEEEINKVKVGFINNLKEITNSPFSLIEYYVSQEYYNFEDIETRIINFQKVNKQKVIDFAKKIYLDTIFVLEGEA